MKAVLDWLLRFGRRAAVRFLSFRCNLRVDFQCAAVANSVLEIARENLPSGWNVERPSAADALGAKRPRIEQHDELRH